MTEITKVAILDEDHVLQLARYALAGSREVHDNWVKDFFLPERVNPADVFALGTGLHEVDGVQLLPRPEKGSELSDASILIFRRGVIDAKLMDGYPQLRLIQRLGARCNTIDRAAAAVRGITVSAVPRLTLHYTAEHAILLMLALGKKLIQSDSAVREARFDPDQVRAQNNVASNWPGLSPLVGLFQSTVGIIGVGEVGSLVAKLASGFGARVIYTNRNRLPAREEESMGLQYVSLDELLTSSDFVSLHATNVTENQGLVGSAFFRQMKPSAFFINTSRGTLVDEDALYSALTTGQIAGVGMDVHHREPRQKDRFALLDNVVMTPHLAGGSRQGVLREIGMMFDDCRAVIAGRPVQHLALFD